MKALRLRGVATHYSSEDVDEEREMEAPPEIRSQPSGTTREPITGNIPSLLVSHLRETERRRRTPSPKRATGVNGGPLMMYYTGCPDGGYKNDEGSPTLLVRKGKAKKTDIQLGEWIASAGKEKPSTEGKEEPILMIGVVNNLLKSKEPPKIISIEEMIFSPIRNRAPSVDPILIKKDIRERMRDVYTTLSGFSSEQVNPLGEISLLIIVGEAPHYRNEQITFLIVRSDSPNNMLLVRTTIVRLGMIPSTMHSVVLYQSEAGPRVIMSEYQDVRRCELVKRLKETPPEAPLQVSECFNPEEKIIINSRHPEANGDHRKTTPHKGQTRVDQAAQRQCRRIRLAVLGHDENPSNTKNNRNKLCH
ncbi:hypothetical protein Tco_1001608 [Tanacetum coccineum]